MTRLALPAAFAVFAAMPALACDGLHVEGAYARASSAMAQSGAAFMQLINHGDSGCRIVAARSDVAERVELHTHIEDDAGVMRMVEVKEGFAIAAEGAHDLARGGDHIMFLGLTRALAHGDEIELTLIFEDGAEKPLTVPVDLERMPDHGHSQDHSHGHSHSHSHSHD